MTSQRAAGPLLRLDFRARGRKDAAFFGQVRVDADLGTIAWPNGADLDPLVLYARVTGQPLPTEKRPVTV